MAEFNCDFSVLRPGGFDCSGRGICVEDNDSKICECDLELGFSSRGDLALLSQDCDISDGGVEILWTITLSIASLCFVVSMVYSLLLLIYKDRYKGRRWRLQSYYLPSIIGSILIFAVSFLKRESIVDPEFQGRFLIGDDVLITLLFILGFFSWWIGIAMLAHRLAKLYASTLNLITGRDPGKSLHRVMVIFIFFIAVCSCFPIGCLVDKDVCFPLTLAFNICFGLISLVFGVIFVPRTISLSRAQVEETVKTLEASTHVNSDSESLQKKVNFLKSMMWKLHFFRKTVKINSVLMMTLFFSFGLWPFVTRKTSYMLALNVSFLGIIVLMATIVVGNEIWNHAQENIAQFGLQKILHRSARFLASTIDHFHFTSQKGTPNGKEEFEYESQFSNPGTDPTFSRSRLIHQSPSNMTIMSSSFSQKDGKVMMDHLKKHESRMSLRRMVSKRKDDVHDFKKLSNHTSREVREKWYRESLEDLGEKQFNPFRKSMQLSLKEDQELHKLRKISSHGSLTDIEDLEQDV